MAESQTKKRLDNMFFNMDRDFVVDCLFQRVELRTLLHRWFAFSGRMWWDYYVLKHPVWKIAYTCKVSKQVVAFTVSDYDLMLDKFGGRMRFLREIALDELELARLEGRRLLTKKQAEYARRAFRDEFVDL